MRNGLTSAEPGVGRFVHAAPLALMRASVLLIAASQIGNVANLLFQVFMMRHLDVREYGMLAALSGLTMALSLPMDAVRSWVAHVSARLSQTGRTRELRAWLRVAVLRLGRVAIVTLLLFILARHRIAGFLGIDRGLTVAWAGLILAASFLIPLLSGAFQGLQAFVAMSVTGQASSVLRLCAGVGLVWMVRPTADMALGGQVAALGVTLIAGLIWLRRILRLAKDGAPGEGTEPPADWRYAVQSLVVLAAAGLLMNADVILARKYFDPESAGSFARAATIARAIIYLPAPIALALFPKVASSGRARVGDRALLIWSIALAALLIGLAAGAASFAMPWIYPLLTGRAPDAAALTLTRSLLLAMSPVGLLLLILNFEMAQHRFRGGFTLLVWAALYMGSVAFRHESPADIVRSLGICGFLALLSLVLFLKRPDSARPIPDSPGVRT